jgi:hypothetical protein
MLFDTCTAPDGRMAEKMGKGFGRRRPGHNWGTYLLTPWSESASKLYRPSDRNWGTIPEFPWKDWGKIRKTSVTTAVSWTSFGPKRIVKTLCYKSESRKFESQRGEWIFFLLYLILLAAPGLGVCSVPETEK